MHRLHGVTDDVNLEHLSEVELVKFLNCTGTMLPILLVCPCVCVCLCVLLQYCLALQNVPGSSGLLPAIVPEGTISPRDSVFGFLGV